MTETDLTFLTQPEPAGYRRIEPADLDLSAEQLKRSANVLKYYVADAFNIGGVGTSFSVELYLGGRVQIEYSLADRLTVSRRDAPAFELGVYHTLGEDRRTLTPHIFYKDADGRLQDSRNTLFAIDRTVRIALPFSGKERPGFIEMLRHDVQARPISSDLPEVAA